MIRAPVPLDVPLQLEVAEGGVILTGEAGAVICQAGSARLALPAPPTPPTLEAARAAGARCMGLSQRVHPACFTCGDQRHEGDGLRVFPGQVDGREAGIVACAWTPHAVFADAEGVVAPEIVWAALDCPGYFSWIEREGRLGALLGTMTGEILRLPKAGQDCIVMAWPLESEGRKRMSGVALFDADGDLLALGHQVWITMAMRAPVTPATGTAVA